jgi:S1-C subfamily serine protease
MNAPIKTAAILTLALLVAGCDAGAQIAAAGAVALFGLGAAAIGEAGKNREAFCQSGSQIYTQYGGCGSGTAITSEEYQRLYKERAEKETQAKIAANDAARSAKTYCLSSISNTPYVAVSGSCQPSDQGISEDQYRSAKEEQVKSLSAPPAEPVEEDKSKPTEVATARPPAPLQTSAQPAQVLAPPLRSTPPSIDRSTVPHPEPTPAAFTDSGLPVIPADAKAVASGTAFFVAPHGMLLTNHHVIEGCRWVGVIGGDGEIHPAISVEDSPKLDLAVIRSDFQNDDVAAFARDMPDVGDDNFVAGFPLLDTLWSLNFTNGIVSSISPAGDRELLQTTAAVQHGNSGGPMFDGSGHVIGVVVAKLKDDTAENVSFAIKATVATAFISKAGISPLLADRGADQKASTIARSAKSLVLPAVCFK